MGKTLHALPSKILEKSYCTFGIFLRGAHKLGDVYLVKLKFEDKSNNDMEFSLILVEYFDFSENFTLGWISWMNY